MHIISQNKHFHVSVGLHCDKIHPPEQRLPRNHLSATVWLQIIPIHHSTIHLFIHLSLQQPYHDNMTTAYHDNSIIMTSWHPASRSWSIIISLSWHPPIMTTAYHDNMCSLVILFNWCKRVFGNILYQRFNEIIRGFTIGTSWFHLPIYSLTLR